VRHQVAEDPYATQPQGSKIGHRRECHNSHILMVTRNGADARPVPGGLPASTGRSARRRSQWLENAVTPDGKSLVYIVYSGKNMRAIPVDPRPDFPRVRLLEPGKRVPCMERGNAGRRAHWLGSVCLADDAPWDSLAPAILNKY
jgi:hypothetical protein